MTFYPDAFLEHYADRFIALRLARHGVNLAQYLANIPYYEKVALRPEPLLPEQYAIRLRLWQQQDTGLGVASPDMPDIDEERLIDPHELVAQWRREAEAAERTVAHLPHRNGTAVEPLHHHRHPRRLGASSFLKRGA